MSKLNKIFDTIPVEIPDRSGFDLSHEVLTTATTGTVVPITYLEVLPGDTFSMGSMMKVTLPPFAVPFMGRIDAELTAAFIPYRLLWNGWQSFITQNDGTNRYTNPSLAFDSAGNLVSSGNLNVPLRTPVISLADSSDSAYFGPGTLSHYLGVKAASHRTGESDAYVSALPFLAYQKFCDDWIRDENNIRPFFPKNFGLAYNDSSTGSGTSSRYYSTGRFLPFNAFVTRTSSTADSVCILRPTADASSTVGELPFDTSLGLGSLRQRCWAKDYFTTATTRPQAGADTSVTFDVTSDTSTGAGTGGFTIATLRAANSLQKWLERNNIAGTEYGSQILAHFGVTPPDATLNRSVLLGSVRTPVVVGSVDNNTGTGAATGTSSPYGNTLGAAAGFGSGFDKGSLVNDFTAKEHGVIMVFFTLIPHAYYNSGLDRPLMHKYVGDFAFPEFAGIGDQPIYDVELSPNANNLTDVFGYQQRYVEYKHKLDSITGLLADGQNMDVYALQRGFSTVPDLGSSFLEIPTDYLDQVLGVDSSVAGFGCMVDAYFDCSALRILPEYSLPHL